MYAQNNEVSTILVLRAIASVLQSPRNRFGKIQPDAMAAGKLREAAEAAGLLAKLPHAGYDSADQCAMLLQALVGDKPVSVFS